jgi:hypothetical protein
LLLVQPHRNFSEASSEVNFKLKLFRIYAVMKHICPHPPSSENMRINFSKTFPRESLGGKKRKRYAK